MSETTVEYNATTTLFEGAEDKQLFAEIIVWNFGPRT